MNTNPSPENITDLYPNQVFVYGANERGAHGAGSAKLALKWGAELGFTRRRGQTYGISTKDIHIQTLPLIVVNQHVADFLFHASVFPETEFLVTAIGTGLAGLSVEDVAPMFRLAPDNVLLPKSFLDILCR